MTTVLIHGNLRNLPELVKRIPLTAGEMAKLVKDGQKK